MLIEAQEVYEQPCPYIYYQPKYYSEIARYEAPEQPRYATRPHGFHPAQL